MKTAIKQKIIRMMASAVLVFFGLFIADNIIFLHAHKLDNGHILVHAHPYNKAKDAAPFKQHSHTAVELLHFSQTQLLFFILPTVFCPLTRTGLNIVYRYCVPPAPLRHFVGIRGREPPFCMKLEVRADS